MLEGWAAAEAEVVASVAAGLTSASPSLGVVVSVVFVPGGTVGMPRLDTALAKRTPGATAVGMSPLGSSSFLPATTSLKALSNLFCCAAGRIALVPMLMKAGRAGLIFG